MQYHTSISGNPQEGIYYKNGKEIGKAFGIIFLRFNSKSDIHYLKDSIEKLWLLYQHLKNISNLFPSSKIGQNKSKGMTVLICYSKAFSMTLFDKLLPKDFTDFDLFKYPNNNGGGPLIDQSDIMYSSDITQNHLLEDDIAFQFIGDSEFIIYRIIVETWKKIKELNENKNIVTINGFYTGFKRDDNRGWLEFDEGVSNIPYSERYDAIFLKNNSKSRLDRRILNGTYLAFLRFEINLEKWASVNTHKQIEIIGRDKITGSRLIGIDKKGNPIKKSRNIFPDTTSYNISNSLNTNFKGSSIYKNTTNTYIPKELRDSIVQSSHTMRLYNIIKETKKRNKYAGIFRQGFEFFEPLNNGKTFRVGLNFVSFQNDLQLLTDSIKIGFSKITSTDKQNLGLEDFVSIRSAGIFFVPPYHKNEKFPGSIMFDIDHHNKIY
jgi:deferrochelatase/peroxidase EfeB